MDRFRQLQDMANVNAAALLPAASIPQKSNACGIAPLRNSVAKIRMGCFWPIIDSNPGTNLIINPFFQFFTRFEKRKFFGSDNDFFTSFGIPAGIAFVFFYEKTAQAADLHAFSLGHGVCHVIEKDLNDPCRL
jgi:hypothetical protein